MKKPYLMGALCLAATLAVMFFGFRENGQTENARAQTFTLLTQEDTGSFLLQLRYGGEAAVDESGNKLSTVTLDQTAPEAQIAELAAEGVSAVLLYAQEDQLVQTVLAACEDAALPVVLLGRVQSGASSASSDEATAGALLMRQALAMNGPGVVVLCHNDAAAVERLYGAMNEPGADAATVKTWYGWNTAGEAVPEGVRALIAQGACIVALNGEGTLAAVQMRADGRLTAHNPILGDDPGDERVTLLENGDVEALALPAPYPMGYLGVQIAEGLTADGRAQRVEVTPKLVTPDTLYSAENVKVAFPLLQ